MKAANPSHALALVLVDELVRCGMTDACLAPGSRSAPLAMVLASDERVRLHVGIDERATAFLALGIARASGRPVAVVTTSGTAAVNLHPAVVEADADRVPLLVLTADRPPELRQTGANQTIDQTRLYGGAVRMFTEVGAPADRPDAVTYWRSLACRAWAAAVGAGGPPGPVHLNVAFREPLTPVEVDARGATDGPFTHPLDGRDGGRPWTRVAREPRVASEETVGELAGLVGASERGVVVAGGGIGAGDAEAVVALAERLGWPLLADPLSGARSGGTAIGSYAALLAHAPFAEAHSADLVLRFGRVGPSRGLAQYLSTDMPQVLVDPDGAWLDPARSVGRVVAADPGPLCRALAGRVGSGGGSGWLAAWQDADAAARAAVDRVLEADDRPSEPRVARDVAAAVPDGGALVVGSSMPVRDLDAFMAPRGGLTVHGNRGASGIDGFVSTALGVAIAHPGPTVALCGDLTLLHDTTGLLYLGKGGADLALVVVNNDGGGIFSLLPQAEHTDTFETVFGTPHGADLGGVVTSLGCGHREIVRAGDLGAAVEEARAAGGVQVVEVRTDRTGNAELHGRLRAAVAEAVGG